MARQKVQRRIRSLPIGKLRKIKAKFRAHIANGLNEDAIAHELGISLKDVKWLKKQVTRDYLDEVQDKKPSEIYALYCMRMEGCITDLNKVKKAALRSKQISAAVGCVKAKQVILNSLMEKGQDLGVIVKKPTQVEFIGGIAIADLSDEDLRIQLGDEVTAFYAALGKYEETSFLDTPSPKIYRALPKQKKKKKAVN